MYVKFSGSCLKQDKITFSHGKTVNIYIVYDLKSNLNNFDPTLKNCLFGGIKLAKNTALINMNTQAMKLNLIQKGNFLHSSGTTGVNMILFGANMSSSVHANNKTKDVLILGEGFIQGLEDITLYGEKMYSVNFTVARKKFCLSLHYNGDKSYFDCTT